MNFKTISQMPLKGWSWGWRSIPCSPIVPEEDTLKPQCSRLRVGHSLAACWVHVSSESKLECCVCLGDVTCKGGMRICMDITISALTLIPRVSPSPLHTHNRPPCHPDFTMPYILLWKWQQHQLHRYINVLLLPHLLGRSEFPCHYLGSPIWCLCWKIGYFIVLFCEETWNREIFLFFIAIFTEQCVSFNKYLLNIYDKLGAVLGSGNV